jgi:hypothetical protein
MPRHFDPQLDILPAAQQEIWEQLRPAPGLSFVLYGGTAVALHFAHRQSVDFNFFRTEPLDKDESRRAFVFMDDAEVIQDSPETLAVLAHMPSGPVRVSFFGGIGFGRMTDPVRTSDDVLLVASLDDLLATKLKATQDRADARDYRDIAELLRAGVSLARALSAFRNMFKGESSEVLRALGYFGDGDLPSLDKADQALLLDVRDQIRDLPPVRLMPGSLAGGP